MSPCIAGPLLESRVWQAYFVCEDTVLNLGKSMKILSKQNLVLIFVDLLLLLLKLIATLPLTSADERTKSLFHRNSSSKIQEVQFNYYTLEG